MAVRCYLARGGGGVLGSPGFAWERQDRRLVRLTRFMSTLKGHRLSRHEAELMVDMIQAQMSETDPAVVRDIVGECETETDNEVAATGLDIGAAFAEMESE